MILIWLSLLFMIVATASIPLLLLIMASSLKQYRRTDKTPNTKIFVIGIVLLAALFLAKIVFITHTNPNALPLPDLRISQPQSSQGLTSLPPSKVNSNDYAADYRWQALPSEANSPEDNLPNPEKIALGQKLFHDKTLSNDKTVSCASCHKLDAMAGADGKKVAEGIKGKQGTRNTPTVWNSAFQTQLFWDGRAHSLEQQALQPMLNPVEMGMKSEQAIINRLKRQPDYQEAFLRAFGEGSITIDKITKALAAYQRTLITNDSPYDDFLRGDKTALNAQQINGMALFEQTGCVLCHNGPNFSMASTFSDGLAMRVFPANASPLTEGLGLNDPNTGKPGVWRIPSLRNVALTGPWLHNGSVDNLEEVVRIMAAAQLGKKDDKTIFWKDEQLVVVENASLTNNEVEDIVAFLHSLSSKRLTSLSNTTSSSGYTIKENDAHVIPKSTIEQ